jgi:hypothetical protein
MGDLEQALLGGHRSRERALLVPEELRLQEVAREPGAVEVDEGLFGRGPFWWSQRASTPFPVPVSRR